MGQKARTLAVARKELTTSFASPMAFIFLGVFLLITLFTFFWIETFFSRGMADVRPLFEWMPVLLIFLVSALTMKMWSEERRMGTLEFLLTSPVAVLELVLGKFLALEGMVVMAIALTLGLPLTVSLMGPLDWGPVFGAYVGSLLMAAAYTAIGLYISSKTDNPIVSLILTTLVCGVFYLVGSEQLVHFLGNRPGEILRLFGSGSRFESIGRGVLDVRDLYYYLSLTAIFVTLNTYSVEGLRWSAGYQKKSHRTKRLILVLTVTNFLAANLWLYGLPLARADLTSEEIYSLSPATREIISKLEEPLLIRGYFSDKTHPLLSPLVPQIRDTLREYAILSQGEIRSEFLDPREEEEIEIEANQRFAIKPVPFHFSDRYKSELVNSYFDILIQYGDQYEVLSFKDLIEVMPKGETDIEVRLRNLEYDITRSIKKVVYGFQGMGQLLETLKGPVKFEGYISGQNLPPPLTAFKGELVKVLEDFKKMAGEKFEFSIQDPSGDAALSQKISEEYGFQPMALGLLSPETFYFYMVIKTDSTAIPVQIPEDLGIEGLRQNMEAALKRMAPGFLKTVGLVLPPDSTPPNLMEPQMGPNQGYQMLEEILGQNYNVEYVDLNLGFVGDTVDVLLVVSPEDLGDAGVFALDQFLMKGATIILVTSPFVLEQDRAGIGANRLESGLEEWLAHHGVGIRGEMVLDSQNANFPVAVRRQLGVISVQEIQMVNYPYSVDIRGEGMAQDVLITSSLPQVTLYWSSPIELDWDKNKGRSAKNLLKSSNRSWVSASPQVEPDFSRYPEWGFEESGDKKSHIVGVLVEGQFESFFKGKPLPTPEDSDDEGAQGEGPRYSGKIDSSPASSRVVIYSSNSFLRDQTLQIAQAGGTADYLNNLQLVQNTLDWSVEDRSLLSIRSRRNFARTLNPMNERQKMLWEYLNYFLVLAGLTAVYLIYRLTRRRAKLRLMKLGYS